MATKTMFWKDIQAALAAAGYTLRICVPETGMEWVDYNGTPLVNQSWDEPPREFHHRALRRLGELATAATSGADDPGKEAR